MKKVLISLLFVFSFFMIACDKHVSYKEMYQNAIEAAERAYRKEGKTGKVEIEKFYGEYNGAYVVNPDINKESNSNACAVGRYYVDEYKFEFPYFTNMAYVIYNNKFYGFDEAYRLGILTLNDIKDMYEVHCTPMLGEVRGSYYDKYLKGIKGVSYKDVKLEKYFESANVSYYRLSCDYIENEEINEVFEVGSIKFEFNNKDDMMYIFHENELYTLKEAYENFDYYKEHINEIYALYLGEFGREVSSEWLKEYYYEYYKSEMNFSLDDVEITNVIGVYGTVIVAQIQPGYGFNLHLERTYEFGNYVFTFENDYYDLDIINLSDNKIYKLDKHNWSLSGEDIRDIWNKLYAE